MGVVTWKNIAPSNPSGILQASVAAHKSLGEGIGRIGTGIKDFSATKTKAETDDFIADLMTAGSQEERDNMIAAANDSWLNLDRVNKTNWELGEPGRAKQAMEDELASRHYFDKIMAGINQTNAMEVQRLKNSGSYTPTKTPAALLRGPDDPENKKFNELMEDDEGWLASWTPIGTDFGPKEQRQIATYANDFLDTYGGDISREDFNKALNTDTIQWDDRFWDDQMTFTLDGKVWTFDEKDSKSALHEKLMQVKRQEAIKAGRDPDKFETHASKVKSDYYSEFVKNNPKLNKQELERVFFRIWNENEDNLIDKNTFLAGSEGAKIFGDISNEKDLKKLGYGGNEPVEREFLGRNFEWVWETNARIKRAEEIRNRDLNK